MNRRDLDQRLRREAAAPTPAPGVRFSRDLADRLRDGLGTTPTPTGPAHDAVLRPRRAWRPPLVGVAAFTALALATVALVRDAAPSGGHSVQLTQASDASVRLPGGAVLAARPGLTVPDGGVVETGAAGRVVADDVEVGPNRRAVVNDGKLAVGATPTSRPRRDNLAVAPAPSSTTPPRGSSPPSSAPAGDTATGAPAASRTVEPLDAKAVWRADGVSLAWSRYEGADFGAYLVLRATNPGDPAYPPDEDTTVVINIADRSTTTFGDRDPGREPRYRVVAIADDGRLLAQSRVLMPETSTTTTKAPSRPFL